MFRKRLRTLLAAGVFITAIATPMDTAILARAGNGDDENAKAAAHAQPNHGTTSVNGQREEVQGNASAPFENSGHPGINDNDSSWQAYAPLSTALEPGVLSFSGATDATASRVTAMVVAPTCTPGNCKLWAGVAGGGVWRTNNALGANPTWTYVSSGIAQNSVGSLTIDPNDPTGNTIYLGTGENNRCTSGCEAGVGIYKTTNGGESWTKLADACVSNATYACATPGQDAFLGRGIGRIAIQPGKANHIYAASALAVRGLSHVIGGGGQVRFEPGANPPGVYESTDGGQHFTEVWNGNDPASFGVTDVALDPADPTTVYATAFDQGLWRRSPSLDGSSSATDFHKVFAARLVLPGLPGRDRLSMALTTKNAKTRIYVTDGSVNNNGRLGTFAAQFWRTDNANQPAATLLATETPGSAEPTATGPTTYNGWQRLSSASNTSPYFATIDFCTGQCWYDNLVYSPNGMPDTVYVLGSFQYGELPCNTKGVGCGIGRSNGRGVLWSTTAGDPDPANNARTFTDLTYDVQEEPANWCALPGISTCVHSHNAIHPDQHVIVVNPNNPTQIFEGSDGGVIRTDGGFVNDSAGCTADRGSQGTGISCQRLLSRVPNEVTHLGKGLGRTLQFVGVSINPGRPCDVQGGTQDNGTWTAANCRTSTVPQIIYGDGGNSGFDTTNPTWRFNEFTSGFSDSNFHDGAPTKWVITSAPVVNSGELTTGPEGPAIDNVAFYWPQISDPNPPAGTHPIFSGAQHVFRTWAFGAGTPGKVPQDTTPNIAFYEANCQEFTVSGNDPNCGDYQPLGGPQGANKAGDLTGTAYGPDRLGGSISWLTRDKADHQTLWAATSAGRIFVTHNANAVNPISVVWHRVDNASSPSRYASSIYPDLNNPSHAWVTYSGYNATTPTTPGHVFSVTESGTFTNLHVESGLSAFPTPTRSGDLPVNDIVRNDQNGMLFVATDFGVLEGKNDGTAGWKVSNGMPRFEVMHLEIQPSARVATCADTDKEDNDNQCSNVIYAATHSQGIWKMDLDEQQQNQQ